MSSFVSAQWKSCDLEGGGARDTWVSLSLVPSSGNDVSLGRRHGVCRNEGSCVLVCEENSSAINGPSELIVFPFVMEAQKEF